MKTVQKFLCIALCLLMCACSSQPNESSLQTATLVLDFVPNTNHTGFYVALEKGWYEEEGIDLNIIEPGNDGTSITLVGAGKGEFGVSYQEDVTYAKSAADPLPITAIATIVQENTSGFVSLKEANIHSPKDFEGKVYAGWQAPSEESVIEAVMKQDGANIANLTMVGADGSGFASLGKSVDLQWEYEGWAVIKGRMEGYDLNFIPLKDLDERLNYYTPLIIGNNAVLEKNPELAKAFMRATTKGFEFAIENPKEAAAILSKYIPEYDLAFIEASQEYLSARYQGNASKWGVMEDRVWDQYTSFMVESGLISEMIPASAQYTNKFIEE
ncbi:MAG: ABC transporter substrate-binding protein [Longicatena sp.]|nr:ABC transporter substrate-binding protein [Longicatena sp.]